MSHRAYCATSGTLFAFIALFHALRIASGWTFRFGPFAVPMAGSIAGFVLASALAYWGFRSCGSRRAPSSAAIQAS